MTINDVIQGNLAGAYARQQAGLTTATFLIPDAGINVQALMGQMVKLELIIQGGIRERKMVTAFVQATTLVPKQLDVDYKIGQKASVNSALYTINLWEIKDIRVNADANLYMFDLLSPK